ncbi:MAG: 3-hydroxyacyl-CoA dehydrogenase NAD-binding domain-containing protein [Sulfurimonas sp.]|nr:3-hydroxyacyl-CoA dehydrogenase NAD-binding domain-containing protein [Sulfurimonas sp.]
MKNTINLSIDENGVAELLFDMPDSPVNLLSSNVLNELEQHLIGMSENKTIKIALFTSAKDGIFIAGADISEIADLDDEKTSYDKVKRGQSILSRISVLPFPTVAIINGACLGGGFELALSCDFRIATENSKTKIGLPEVNLGVLPGFGGTQRLKRLIGFSKSLELILGGKIINGNKAQKLGMVDACVPVGYLDFKQDSFIKSILDDNERSKILSKRYKDNLLEKYLPNIILYFAKKEVMKKTKGQYPAPLAILDLFEQTKDVRLDEAIEMEATSFAKLSITQISKNLIGLFYTSEALKKENGTDKKIKTHPIKLTAVVGGGIMGAGIVWLFSKIGLSVRLVDQNYGAIGNAFKFINSAYQAIVKRRRLTKREVEIKMGHISYSCDYVGLKHADLCVEAIIENREAKKKLYANLEAIVDKKAIIATNTSSISVTSLAGDMKYPERFVGMHFFNPVNRMPLVEIIAGEKTSPEAVATVVELAKRGGKIPIIVGDCAGFLVNRVLLPYINEAIKMFEEGEDIERIDKLILDFGMPMGPFTLADEVGLDVGYKVGCVLEEAYGKRMKVANMFDIIYNQKKLLGKKAGKGFYIHSGKNKSINKDVKDLVTMQHSYNSEEIVDRMMLVMLNEASRCLEEGVIKNADYLDMALILGTGFPPFRGGLMRYAQNRGINNVVVTLHRLADAYGSRFEPCELLIRMAKNNENFFEE